MTFDPTSVDVTCVTLPKDHCIQVPWKYIKVCGYSDYFSKSLTKRSVTQMTCRWYLTPLLLRSRAVYPRIIVSNSHKNTSKHKWIQWPFFFKNFNQRSVALRWPLTPLLLRSHVWIYPRIIMFKFCGNTSMYVDTLINFAKHTTYYILCTYILRTERVITEQSSGEAKN